MDNHSQSSESKGQSESSSILQQTRIILVEPAGPLNIGSVARVMKNFGLSRLILVQPRCDPWVDPARQMAVHAQEILLGAIVAKSLSEALVGCHQVLATTGRSDRIPFPLVSPRQVFGEMFAPHTPQQGDRPDGFELALVFGREDRGLTHAELTHAHQVLEIPTSDQYASLNLAQAVGVCCYELFQSLYPNLNQSLQSPDQRQPSPQTIVENLPKTPLPQSDSRFPAQLPATYDQLEAYYRQLEDLLLRIGYLYPHTATSRMEKFRHLYQRANLSDQEVAMLRGILRQTEWALQQH